MNLFTSIIPVKQETNTRQVHAAVSDGLLHGGSFVSSILAGTLVGYFADLWLGTDPWLVITGVVLGSYTGFMRIWALLKSQDGDPREW